MASLLQTKARPILITGLVAMVAGAFDPLEGSVVIVMGAGLVALAAHVSSSSHRRLLKWAFGLVVSGVGALWTLSAIGGFGGETDRSLWWVLLLLPYPIGWIAGITGAVLTLREASRHWP